MGEKLKEIKETTSDLVHIIRELSKPEVQESLNTINHTTGALKNIIASLNDQTMVKNIENIRLTAQSIQDISVKIENMVLEVSHTGIIDKTNASLEAAKGTLESVNNQGNFGELLGAIKDMLNSIIGLVEELKLSIRSTRKSGLVHDMGEVIQETKNINDNAVGKNLNREL